MAGAASSRSETRTLTFRVGEDRFSLPASIVREVTRLPRLTRVPHAPASLMGLGNFRGAVVPVVSFARLADRTAVGDQGRRVILLDAQKPVALAVDDVTALGTDVDAQPVDIDALTVRDFGTATARKARVTAIRSEPREATAESYVPLVTFVVAGQDYALPIGAVEEVVRLPDAIALMPHADDVAIGSIALRGAILPLLSLRGLLGLPGRADFTHARVVVVRIGQHRVGLIADAMRAILRVAAADVDPVPAALARGTAEARIQAICRIDGGRRLVSVLAAEHLLREDLTARLLQGSEQGKAERNMADRQAAEQFLLFRVGDDEFGLPVDAVVEVVRLPAKLAPLPDAPAFVRGVMNLRGRVIPVIDQTRRFRGVAASGAKVRVIVIRLGEAQAGFVVDAVSEILRIPVDEISPAPDLGGEETRLFDRVANLTESGRMALIVSPQQLLDRAERALLAGLNGDPGNQAPA